MTAPPGRLTAVLDTSFWAVAYRAEIAANCLDLFDIIVPKPVEEEICARPAGQERREFPQATLFRHLRGQMKGPPTGATERLPVLGRGEAEAIALAQRLGVPLLMNDWRAARYAQGLGVTVITPGAVIVTLYTGGVISGRAALRKIEAIGPFTTQEFVNQALRAVR